MLKGLTGIMNQARASMAGGDFQKAGTALSDAKSAIREEIQSKTAADIADLIDKLGTGETLTPQEVDLVKFWIVGDAESYTKMENNFDDWLAEYERLQNTIGAYENRECSLKELFNLQGILEDAVRVDYDIANFLEKRERIRRFESAVEDGLDKHEKDVFVRVLKDKLQASGD